MCVLIVSGIGGRPGLSSPDCHSGELMTFLASCPKRSLADDGRHLSNMVRVAFNGFSSPVSTGFIFIPFSLMIATIHGIAYAKTTTQKHLLKD